MNSNANGIKGGAATVFVITVIDRITWYGDWIGRGNLDLLYRWWQGGTTLGAANVVSQGPMQQLQVH